MPSNNAISSTSKKYGGILTISLVVVWMFVVYVLHLQ